MATLQPTSEGSLTRPTVRAAHRSTAGTAKLGRMEFDRIARLVYERSGITIPAGKMVLLEGRLRKRLAALGIPSFKLYWEFLRSSKGAKEELVHMIDVVSTNKTDFFREPQHFDYLRSNVLPALHTALQGRRAVRVWSAACSSGEEPYTLAMVLQEFAQDHPGFDFRIMATDISTKVLQHAVTAVYAPHRISGIPVPLLRKYFLRSKDTSDATVRVGPLLRGKVQFARTNLLEAMPGGDTGYDVIFCRNVLIYFDRPTREDVVRRMAERLTDGGHLFLGHSESLHGMELSLDRIRPTIYTATR